MTIPVPVLDDRSFDQLVAEAKARVPVHTPEWTNLNASDPGVTVVDLFAFLTENLLYRSNRVPEANRLKFLTMLGISLMPPSPGVGLVSVGNDKGPLTALPLPRGTQVLARQVPFETTLPMSVLPVSAAVFYKKPQTTLDDATRARYKLIYQTFLDVDTDTLSFYQPEGLPAPTTGKPDPVLDLGDPTNGTVDRAVWVALLAPKNADLDSVRAAISEQTLSIGVYPATGIVSADLAPMTTGSATTDPGLIVEIAAPEPDPSGLSGPGFGIGPANYTRLPVSYADPVLQAPGIVQVTLPPHDRLMVWAFDPEEEGTGDYPPRVDDADVAARIVTWIRLRLSPDPQSADSTASPIAESTTTTDARTGDCGCGCGDAGPVVATSTALAAAGDRPTGQLTWVGVNTVPVVQSVPVREERLGVGTGTPWQTFTLANTPALAAGLTVTVQALDGTRADWHAIDDIYAAGPDELAFQSDPASGRITTGNGLQGARVPLGSVVLASYSYGGGVQGQVAIGAINRGPTLQGFAVANPVPTWGASTGESVADGETAITRWLRHRDRLVTMDDFRDLTRRTPGVDLGRVEVLPLFNPDQPGTGSTWPGMVTVLVIPRSDPLHVNAPTPDRQFLNAVCAWLDPRRLVTTEVHARGPQYQPIWVSVGVEVLPGQVPSQVVQAVKEAVQTFLSPLHGGLDGSGWPLGIDVRSQDVEAVATRVPGVRYVDSVRIAATGAGGTVVGSVDPVPIAGLQLPAATVYVNQGPADDPAALIGSSQPVPSTQVSVPVVPPTC